MAKKNLLYISYRRLKKSFHKNAIFFHPDYTVGTGITPVHALRSRTITADQEFHLPQRYNNYYRSVIWGCQHLQKLFKNDLKWKVKFHFRRGKVAFSLSLLSTWFYSYSWIYFYTFNSWIFSFRYIITVMSVSLFHERLIIGASINLVPVK